MASTNSAELEMALATRWPIHHQAPMLADDLLRHLDQALDSALADECDRPERLALAVWWLVDRLGEELDLDPAEAAGQVQMMAALAAEQMGCGGPERH